MGYTLELRAVSLDQLVGELISPSLSPAEISARPDDEGELEVLRCWSELAAEAAALIQSGGGEVAWPLSGYLQLLTRHFGRWFGALPHTSSGGDQFRDWFLPGLASATLGDELIHYLTGRPLVGLVWVEYPMFGWATNAELRKALLRGLGPLDNSEELDLNTADSVEAVWALVDAVTQMATNELDLVTIYA